MFLRDSGSRTHSLTHAFYSGERRDSHRLTPYLPSLGGTAKREKGEPAAGSKWPQAAILGNEEFLSGQLAPHVSPLDGRTIIHHLHSISDVTYVSKLFRSHVRLL